MFQQWYVSIFESLTTCLTVWQGAFLQDNYEAVIIATAPKTWDDYSEDCTMQLNASDLCYEQWLTGFGPYSGAAGPISIVYRTTSSDDENQDMFMLRFPGAAATGFYPGFSHPKPAPAAITWDLVQMPGPGDDARGSVTLRSRDPRDTPVIDFNFCNGDAGQRDIEALVEGVDLVLRILKRMGEPMAPFTLNYPEEGVDFAQFFRDWAFGHHATGTCRMGLANDPNACIDPNFRVHGG